jgi:DNA-binding transcriptional LysR family regulator
MLLRGTQEWAHPGSVDLLAQMATFMRVVEVGSLSGAARAEHLSLAAVSRQLSALEEALGTALLLRTTRKITVTDAGKRYYEHCVRILKEVDAAQSSVRRVVVTEGLLSVTVPVTYGLARVSPYLPSLIAKHPRLTIDVRVEDKVVDLVSEGVDVAIRTGTTLPDSTSLIARKLTSYRRVLVASPHYLQARGEPKTPDDLVGHEAVLHLAMGGSVTSWTFSHKGKEISVPVRGTFRSNAPYVLRDGAVSGLGLAILPDWLVAEDVREKRLKIILGGYELAPVIVTGVHRAELRGEARVRALLDHLIEAYAGEDAATRGGVVPGHAGKNGTPPAMLEIGAR